MLTLIDSHYREATALYQRRGRLLNAPASPMTALRQLDGRLVANLDAVAIHQTGHPDAAQRLPDLFVEAWVGLQRDQARCLAVLDEIYPELCVEQKSVVGQAVCLSCSGSDGASQVPALQAAMMSPQAVMALSEEDAGKTDPALAMWLMHHDAAGDDLTRFQPYYQDDSRPRSQRYALQAGLVRADQDAIHAARRFQDDAVFALLLALNGQPPETLLGLGFSGSAGAARQLLNAMGEVARCEEAAQAWFWLKGEPAPRKPRLQAVGEGDGVSRDSLPDATEAARCWEAAQWQADARYFFGQRASASSLEALGQQWVGQVSALVAAQQSWLAGHRVLPKRGWQLHPLAQG